MQNVILATHNPWLLRATKAGLSFRRMRMDRVGTNVPRRQFTFNREVARDPVADFLAAQSQSRESIQPVQFRQHTWRGPAACVRKDWILKGIATSMWRDNPTCSSPQAADSERQASEQP